jgi:D-cysteine desulfhydrase
MPRLAKALGLGEHDLWVKRDDLSGLGGGGNKVRKLERTVGAALDDGADTLVTTGAPQSNHARLTAAAAARLGLQAVLVFPGAPDTAQSGNYALDGLFGARIAWAGPTSLAEYAQQVADHLRADGAKPALIPFGGSSPLGALGYADAGRELLNQLPDLTTVVVAVGSGGTMAGLVAALGVQRVLGVHCGAVPDPREAVAALMTGIGDASSLRINLDQVGAGYGTLTDEVMAALELAARTEGIVLDPIYTGRAMAGLIAAARGGDITAGQRTVFLHTGGLPGFFGHPDTVSRARAGAGGYALD